MNKLISIITISVVLILTSCCEPKPTQEEIDRPDYVIVIHGGAGSIERDKVTRKRDSAYRVRLNESLLAGEQILKNGGHALDAVEASIRVMEDSPLFNAGRGAVLTAEKKAELDASIMNGADLNAGAVAGVKTIKNPITAARAVMEQSKHVMLVSDGAEIFAAESGLDTVSNDYFITPRRKEQIEKITAVKKEYGTVGCVVLDKYGNLAAGTSTGGMTNKRWGRVGDSPVIGAGTYADNEACAVSATGHGEYFIRHAVAYDVVARYKYLGKSVQESLHHILHEKFADPKVSGGLIAVDKNGNVALDFNTSGMFRGFIKSSGEKEIKIYREE